MSKQPTLTPVIVHLSGRRRGQTQRLCGEVIRVGTGDDAEVRIGSKPGFDRPIMANLVLKDATYEFIAEPGMDCWVNGQPGERVMLDSGDVLEIGRPGTVLRFRLYPGDSKAYKTFGQAFSDCADCAHYSTTNPLTRLAIMVLGPLVELATQTPIAVRVAFLLMVAMTIGSGAIIWHQNRELERQVIDQTAQIKALSERLKSSESASFNKSDLLAAQRETEDRFQATIARLNSLEQRQDARSRVIGEAAESVVFLQGGYSFVHVETGKILRLALATDGQPVLGSDGRPATTLDGDGPLFELLFTGTGFVVSDDGQILTNRHVAVPWKMDANALSMADKGFEADMHRFDAYLPGQKTAFKVQFVAAHPTADIALLQCPEVAGKVMPLKLNPTPPQLGAEVIVIGYPTGIRALMARVDPAYMNRIMSEGPLDFWQLAETLAQGGYILPLATVGIVGQQTRGYVVYDAETTQGGSGSPVLDINGNVVAVNTAILAEFGGSNLGVPASTAEPMLSDY